MAPNQYAAAHTTPHGPGDARPTALQIIKDEGLEGQLDGKTILITGCSSGIGIETTRVLAATGATLFLTARDIPKAIDALCGILSPGKVELLHCDLTSLSSVRACAREFLEKSKTLNILICNAGVMAIPTRTLTQDGFETHLATNHLAHFLLTNLLLPTLLASSTPTLHSRVIALTSSEHRVSPVHFDDLNLSGPSVYTPQVGYGQSKTANIYMTNSVERHYGSKGVHGIAVHPGGIWTPLQRHIPAAMLEEFKQMDVLEKLMKSPEQGCATTVLAAVGKEYEGRGGLYLENCGEWGPVDGEKYTVLQVGYEKHAFDENAEEKLWGLSLGMVGLGGS